MKNIHLIPTDKPSRLHITGSKLGLYPNGLIANPRGLCKNQYIYITNDEKPKYRDWCLSTDKNFLIKLVNIPAFSCDKKVILTTDPDLIADGVQAIDDDFLEWFVKNSSCEYVEVKKGKLQTNDDGQKYGFPNMSLYEIIIPQVAQWMEEKSYTEEEVKLLLDKVLIDYSDIVLADIPEWFEKNKKN
jgi:hypothetical protein